VKRLMFVLILLLVIAGCATSQVNSDQNQDSQDRDSENQNQVNKEVIVQENEISFEISPFSYNHETSDSERTYSDTYEAIGRIVAKGNEEVTNKPYMVLIEVTRIDGSEHEELRTSGVGVRNVLVFEGEGKFSVSDSVFFFSNDNKFQLEKPEYEAKVIGYIPYNLIKNIQ
jgi:hypothetical protein